MTSEDYVEFEFERTFDDYVDFNIFDMTYSPRYKKTMIIIRILTALFCAVFIFSLSIVISYLFLSSIVTSFLIVGIVLGIGYGIYIFIDFPRIYRKSTTRSLKKNFLDSNNKTLFGHTIISFSADGIASKTDFGESKIKWSGINKVARSKKLYLFYTSSEKAIILPKRCFHSTKEEEDFIDLINTCRQQSL
jgi:hypothetical protein